MLDRPYNYEEKWNRIKECSMKRMSRYHFYMLLAKDVVSEDTAAAAAGEKAQGKGSWLVCGMVNSRLEGCWMGWKRILWAFQFWMPIGYPHQIATQPVGGWVWVQGGPWSWNCKLESVNCVGPWDETGWPYQRGSTGQMVSRLPQYSWVIASHLHHCLGPESGQSDQWLVMESFQYGYGLD